MEYKEYIDQIRSLADQLEISSKFEHITLPFDNIVIAGLGGSGTAGKIFQELYTQKPVILVEGYDIPDFVNKNTIFISMSYSGNTEETVAATKRAIEKGAHIFIVTSGGWLSKLNFQKVIVPAGLQPRRALGYMLMPLINTFLDLKKENLESTVKMLREMDEHHDGITELAKQICDNNLIPVIYGYAPFKSISYKWKIEFNETGKVLAYSSSFPELNHTDVMPLWKTYRKEEFVFLVFDEPKNQRIQRRIDITERLTKNRFVRIKPKGWSDFEKAFYLIHYCDYLAYYLATFRKIDPSDISLIDELKNELSKFGVD